MARQGATNLAGADDADSKNPPPDAQSSHDLSVAPDESNPAGKKWTVTRFATLKCMFTGS